MRTLRITVLTFSFALALATMGVLVLHASDTARENNAIRYVAPGADCGGASPCYGSIQQAVDAATEGDLIKIATGTYSQSSSRDAPPGSIGSETIPQVVYLDKSVKLSGGYTTPNYTDPPDPDANPVVLDAQSQGRVLFIAGLCSPVIEGLQLTGGQAAGLGGNVYSHDIVQDAGGGTYAISATVTMSQCLIHTNVAQIGGGIYIRAGSARVARCLISDNQAIVEPVFGGNGAGVFLDVSNAHIFESEIVRNVGHHEGAGLFASSSPVTLTKNIIESNSNTRASVGGGVALRDSDGIVIDNSLSYNYGGGISIIRGHSIVMSNTIEYNESGGQGAGVHILQGYPSIIGNSIVGNYAHFPDAERLGGGMYVGWCQATVKGNLIEDNMADNGGGIYSDGYYSFFDANIIRRNRALGEGYDLSGGGGIYLFGAHDTLANNLIVDNFVDELNGKGGGMYIKGSSPKMLHNTISGNDAEAIFITEYDGVWSHVELQNTIISSHTVGVENDSSGNTVDADATLWYDNGANWVGSVNHTNDHYGSPQFLDPQEGDYHIWLGSEAINQGIDAGIYHDIDGEVRPFGGAFDIGADEFPAGFEVTKSANPSPAEAGSPVTYTITMTNVGKVALTPTVTDTLPEHVLPGGVITWTPNLLLPSATWRVSFVVTVEPHYAGDLTNLVEVSTVEGLTGSCQNTIASVLPSSIIYLPVILRGP